MIKTANRFIKLYSNNNQSFIVDVDMIEYIIDGEMHSTRCGEQGFYSIIHSIEKVQEIIKQSGYYAPMLYLHRFENNNTILINCDYIHSITAFDDKGTSIYVGKNKLQVVETVESILKKINEIKTDSILIDGNVNSAYAGQKLSKSTAIPTQNGIKNPVNGNMKDIKDRPVITLKNVLLEVT